MSVKLILIPLLVIGTYSLVECQVLNMHDIISSIFNTGSGTPTTSHPTPPRIINPARDPVTKKPVVVASPTKAPVPLNPGGEGGHSYKKCGDGMECVFKFLCANGKVTTDGATLIDIRIDDDTSCPFLETCCAVKDKVTDPIVREEGTPSGCGYRNIEGVGFKIEGAGDNMAQFGEFPWMMAILREENALDKVLIVYQCGGSLLTPQVVLTAAHCVQASSAIDFKVRAGEWETSSKAELHPDQERQVVEMIVHEHYNKGSLYNDIALLFLDSPFDLAPNVNTICLPPAGVSFDYSRCCATGWGKDQFQNGQYQEILKKIDLPVVPNDKCQTNLRSTRLGKYFQLDSSFMCAGGERGKDTCTGDGGSPLVCPIDNQPNRFYQAGIVSWGIGCGDENVPGVYASVPQLRAWIDEQLAYKRIWSSSFTAYTQRKNNVKSK